MRQLTRHAARNHKITTSLSQHVRQNGFRKGNNTEEIDRHDSLVNRKVGVDNGASLGNTRVVEQIINPAKSLPYRIHMGRKTICLHHVDRQNQQLGIWVNPFG